MYESDVCFSLTCNCLPVQSNKPESRDLPTWLEDSPSAVKGAVVGSLEHDSDDDEQEGKWAQDAKAVVDENGFKEKTLVDASPGDMRDRS